jgi:hypothetical protein
MIKVKFYIFIIFITILETKREFLLTNDVAGIDKDDFQKFYEEMNLKLLNYK